MSTNMTPEDAPELHQKIRDGMLNLLAEVSQVTHPIPCSDRVAEITERAAYDTCCETLTDWQDEIERREAIGHEWLQDQQLEMPLDALLPPATIFRCPVCTVRFLDHPTAVHVTDGAINGHLVTGLLCPACATQHGYMP